MRTDKSKPVKTNADPEAMAFKELTQAAKAQQPGAMTELRRRIGDCPDLYNGIKGNLALLAEEALLGQWNEASGEGALVTRECMRRKLQAVKDEIAGVDPSPLERLLIERIGLCWLQVHSATARVAVSTKLQGGHPSAQFHGEQEAKAHRMLLSAIKALAQVRKLQIPNVQINVGEKQINVKNG